MGDGIYVLQWLTLGISAIIDYANEGIGFLFGGLFEAEGIGFIFAIQVFKCHYLFFGFDCRFILYRCYAESDPNFRWCFI